MSFVLFCTVPSVHNTVNARAYFSMSVMVLKFFPDAVAVIFGLLLFPWILGVPGMPDQLVRLGWTTGLTAIILYLIVYQMVKSSDRISALRKPEIRLALDRLLFGSAWWFVAIVAASVYLVVLH